MIAAALARRSLIARGLALGLLPLWRASAATDRFVWGIDYGAETDPAIARRFHLLVLEPGHARPIAPLRGPGAKLLGYISLGEVEPTGPTRDRSPVREPCAYRMPTGRMPAMSICGIARGKR